jgi:hypothetical protein
MKVQNRQQLLVVLALAMVGLYVGVNFVLTPLEGWWTARSHQIRDLRDKVNDGQSMIKRETGIRNHWSDMQNNALPLNTAAAEAKLLGAVDNWSRDCGVDISSVTPQWKDDNTNYMTLNCHVETAGDISSLSRFLYDLEKGPMMLRVDAIELTTHDNTGQQLTMGLDLDGLVLTHPETK